MLRAVSPPFGRLVKEQAELAGEYRALHSRVITYAEEIAFYGGETAERTALRKAYDALAAHAKLVEFHQK